MTMFMRALEILLGFDRGQLTGAGGVRLQLLGLPQSNLALLALLVLAAALIWLVWRIYRREGDAPRAGKIALASLRIVVMLALLALLLQPALALRRVAENRATVAVLIDDSLSMSLADRYDGLARQSLLADRLGIEPDIICMAKGIASGFPLSALGTRRELDDLWPTGSHGGTYGGNPIGCAAAIATIEVMSEPGFLDNVRARGGQLRDGLSELKEHHPELRQVRGPGLMVASSFEDPSRVPKVLDHCLREGRLILMNAGTNGNIVRWMPPLVVSAAEVDEAIGVFTSALKATA